MRKIAAFKRQERRTTVNRIYYEEFLQRVALNFGRLSGETYRGGNVFRDPEYSWEGDWEGRALLAFVCLKRLTGNEIPTLQYEIELLRKAEAAAELFPSLKK